MTPISYIFTELDKIETQKIEEAFGPVGTTITPSGGTTPQNTYSEKKFNLTNVFTSKKDVNPQAFAVTDGILFIVPQKESTDLVNIFLKPTNPVDIGLKIKYYVYRGVKIDKFFQVNGASFNLLPKGDSNILPFLDKIWDEFLEYNGIPTSDANTVSFDAKHLGFHLDIQKNYRAFFNKDQYSLPKVKMGAHIGNFGEKFGFEVVVDEGDFSQDHSDTGFEFGEDYFTARQCVLNLDKNNDPKDYGNLPDTFVSEKIFREAVYLFLDPAAYYGSHVTINNNKNLGTIKTPTEECKMPSKIYNICIKFFNIDKTYLYIKSKRGRSYSFYPNVPIISNPIEIKNDLNHNFSDNQWPLRIMQTKDILSFKLNIFSPSCSMACHIGIGKSFYKPLDLLKPDVPPAPTTPAPLIPDLVNFTLPNDGTFPAKKITSVVYLTYDDGIEVIQDKLFGKINLKTIFEQEDFEGEKGSYVNHLRPVLIKDGSDIGLYQTKVVLHGDYISSNNNPPVMTDEQLAEILPKNLRTYILFPQKTTRDKKDQKIDRLTAGYYSAFDDVGKYCNAIYGEGNIWRGVITDNGTDIYSLLYRRKDNDEDLPVYQLGISQADYKFLEDKVKELDKDATNFFFNMEEDVSSTSSAFIKFKLKMQFDKKDGTLGATTDSVAVYTIDGYFFFTREYSTGFDYFNEFPKVTAEFLPRDNYNGEFGFDWLRKGDIDGTIKDKPFNKIIADHYKASDHSILEDDGNEWKGFYKFNRSQYFKLKNKEYQALPVNWKLGSETDGYEKDSAVSYLNIYRTGITPNPRAKLRLLIRVNQKPARLYIKYPKDLFVIRLADGVTTPDNNPLDGIYRTLEIPTTSIPTNDAKNFVDLEIENIADIRQDTAITIHTETAKVCGKMMVQKNDEVFSKKIQIVQFRDQLPIDANNVGEQDAEVNGLENIDLFLKHANIKIDYEPNMVINITNDTNFSSVKIDPIILPNQNPKYRLLDPAKPTSHNDNLEKASLFKINLTTTSTTNPTGDASKKAFENHIGAGNINNYKNHLILCYTDRISSVGTKAFAHDNNFMFIAKDIPVDAYAHEVFHALGISHTFDNDGNYAYMNGSYSILNSIDKTLINPSNPFDPNYGVNNITDNLMDYFITRKTTFKWQWDIMRKKLKEIK
jgi:hypothetical protein